MFGEVVHQERFTLLPSLRLDRSAGDARTVSMAKLNEIIHQSGSDQRENL